MKLEKLIISLSINQTSSKPIVEAIKLAKDLNMKLLHITEDEWIYNQKLLKAKLKYILKCSEMLPKIAARNCIVQPIEYDRKKNFLDRYHIQGNDIGSKISLGLFYKDNNKLKLVSVMTFSKPNALKGQSDNYSYDYELSRFANISSYIVYGSFNKLFSYFKENYTWNVVYTFADLRFSTGELYEKNGWKYVRTSEPGYWYSDGNIKLHRAVFSKQKLKSYYESNSSKYHDKIKNIYDESLSADKITLMGYNKIFNAGNLVYEYSKL